MTASRSGINLPPAAPTSGLIEYHDTTPFAVRLGRGSVFMTGQSWTGTSFDYATIKYAVSEPVASPPLGIQRLGNSVVLSWTNAAFGLQSLPSVSGTFTNIVGATSPYTNSISGGQRFFRLVQ